MRMLAMSEWLLSVFGWNVISTMLNILCQTKSFQIFIIDFDLHETSIVALITPNGTGWQRKSHFNRSMDCGVAAATAAIVIVMVVALRHPTFNSIEFDFVENPSSFCCVIHLFYCRCYCLLDLFSTRRVLKREQAIRSGILWRHRKT